MRLFIAEKPSLGRAIAQYLPTKAFPQGGSGKGPTHLVAGNDIVTWAFGHLLEMAEPEHYGEGYKRWSFSSLPIIPEKWELIPKEDAKAQIQAIQLLLADCSEVVNAGDPDREGQLLIDEILEYLGNTKPVRRIWLSALDETSIRKALSNLRNNADYANLKSSAEARQRGDWLVGMNLTRAYTLAGRQSGYDGVLSVGRVQTPTLALIVNRDLDIEDFKPKDFYAVVASIKSAGAQFLARWKPSEGVVLDEEGRLLNKNIAENICEKVTGQKGKVVKFEALEKKQAAPLPFSLSGLQAVANKKLGLSAQEVLNIAQELYESKLTSYPRTDCTFLPESQHGDATRILSALPNEYLALVKNADVKLKSLAWNDKKVTAHHAIIPTGQKQNLFGKKAQVYDLIVRSYLCQFYPPYTYRESTLQLEVKEELFVAKGKIPLSQGWKAVYSKRNEDDLPEKEDEKSALQNLPALKKNALVTCENASVESKKTTPPARFTEGTLIQAMTNIHQLVQDPELKKRLKENAGIGTEATRAGIIETLKRRRFIEEHKKQIISTDSGRKLVKALPEAVKSPGLTGLFEQLLTGVAEGRISSQQFLTKQAEFVTKYVGHAKTSGMGLLAAFPCPRCEKGHLRRIKTENGFFWGCSRYRDGCRATFSDLNEAPDFNEKKAAYQKKLPLENPKIPEASREN